MNMKLLKLLTMASLMVFLTAGLSACSDNKAENAGEKVDEMMQDAGNAVEDACEDVKEGMKAEDPDC
jgi:NAD(P)H-hydrate repair Nnr-like enzyme with NAD(P)H-hydrate epimerase domain|tara:strand:+ start:1924 stop:2124 length:201 start_codon:yes stop_codon:yes gene_type:complete